MTQTTKHHNLQGKFIIVTGANSGIGKELARQYAAMDATVILACRSIQSGEETITEIKQQFPNARLYSIALDLSSLASVAFFADQVKAHFTHIDILLLNAGIHIPYKTVLTQDGFETQYQVNYLADFLLVCYLLPLIRQSELKSVVYTSSDAHKMADFKGYPFLGFWMGYALSKQAGISWMYTLINFYPTLNFFITSPKRVKTNVHRYKSPFIQKWNALTSRYQDPTVAAQKIITIVSNSENRSKYWYDGRQASPSKICLAKLHACNLWNKTVDQLSKYLPLEYHKKYTLITNFAGNVSVIGPEIRYPTSVEQIKTIIIKAKQTGQHIRVVGKRHSYNDNFLCRDILLSLDMLQTKVELQKEKQSVICSANLTVRELCDYLDKNGYTLPFAGAFGEQTVVGALTTGTHGFFRNGGVMSELVTEVILLDAFGTLRQVTGDDLQAARLSLGLLGVILFVTLSVKEKSDDCSYTVKRIVKEQFLKEYLSIFSQNQYFRFFPHPFLPSEILYVTINTFPKKERRQKDTVYYLASSDGSQTMLLNIARFFLKRNYVMRILQLFLTIVQRQHTIIQLTTEFSSFLFINEGITSKMPRLMQFSNRVINNNRDYCHELVIRLEELPKFLTIFDTLKKKHGFMQVDFRVRLSGRAVGSADNTLLAPNNGRDVLFMDVFVERRLKQAMPFLQELENETISSCSVRFHWGKEFFTDFAKIEKMYPKELLQRFKNVKVRYDPIGMFSNHYSKRVLNI